MRCNLRKRVLSVAVGLAVGCSAGAAAAAPFGSFDARSAAMGDVGVASATLASAGFFNPAMMSAQAHPDKLAVLLPAVGLRVADPQNLIGDIDNFQSAYNANNASGMQSALQDANGKAMLVNANADISGAYAGDHFAVGVLANAYTMNGMNITANFTTPSASTLNIRGLEVLEVGVPLSYGVDLGDVRLAVGLTPKHMTVRTTDFQEPLTTVSTSGFDLAKLKGSQEQFSTNNADLGVALGLGNWRAGVVARNLADKSFGTILGNTITLDRQVRAGVAYDGRWLTVAADMDLTTNQPVSFEPRTRMAALGAELNVFRTVQLRAGVAHNMADTPGVPNYNIYSAGVGFSALGVHADVAAATSGNSSSKDLSAFAQLGFRF